MDHGRKRILRSICAPTPTSASVFSQSPKNHRLHRALPPHVGKFLLSQHHLEKYNHLILHEEPCKPLLECAPPAIICQLPGKAPYLLLSNGNVKKCAVGKHPKSEKHGNTAQFSEVERSGTQENCGGIGSGCRLRLRPLPVLRRRQSQRVARIDPNAVVVDKNIAENDRFDLFSR